MPWEECVSAVTYYDMKLLFVSWSLSKGKLAQFIFHCFTDTSIDALQVNPLLAARIKVLSHASDERLYFYAQFSYAWYCLYISRRGKNL